MVRAAVLGLMTTAVVAFGVGMSTPADARVNVYFGFGNGIYYGHHVHHCGWRNVYVKVWSHKKHKWVKHWVTKRVCW